ncbi:hypothetical protein [Arthrobacter ginkgonis]
MPKKTREQRAYDRRVRSRVEGFMVCLGKFATDAHADAVPLGLLGWLRRSEYLALSEAERLEHLKAAVRAEVKADEGPRPAHPDEAEPWPTY